jgi:transmembrane sensor
VIPSGARTLVYEQVAAQLRRHRRTRFVGTLIAMVTILSVSSVWRIYSPAPSSVVSPPAPAIVCAPPKQLLPDGSVVELKDAAVIAVEFTDAIRRVILRQGEAHFQVAKNPARPFVVVAGGLEVRAVGTAFCVQLGSGAVEVLVTEGHVAVEKPIRPTPRESATAEPEPLVPPPQLMAVLAAGNRVIVDLTAPTPPSLPVEMVSAAELSLRLAWRVPRLEFSSRSLAEVVSLFNRYAPVRLIIADEELARLELSGVLRADNVESLLQLLDAEFRIRADRRDGEIVLHR